MKLRDWCAKNPDKVPALRLRVSVHPKKWPSLARGEFIPRSKVMGQIARGTSFEVTANDFYGIDPLKAAEATHRIVEAEAAKKRAA